MRATRAIINLDRFYRNFANIRERIGPDRRICVPIKADAYGHGALQIAQAALKAGASCLGAAMVQEGTELREGGIDAPILLFSQPLAAEIPEIIQNRLSPFVSDRDFAQALNQAASSAGIVLPVHLKIDTGMGRMGCSPADAPDLARYIADCKALNHQGTATHLAVSDSADPDEIAYTGQQLTLFQEALDAVRAAGCNPGIVHAANSGAVILHPQAWLDMVRPGILLYGYKMVEEGAAIKPLNVEPLMELRTNIVFLKKVKKGDCISYGRTWTAPRDTLIGTLPLGYGDGLPRLVSNKWQVSIRGRAYPLVGRICMDQCLVDLGPDDDSAAAEIRRWDEVSVFGGPAQDAAALAAKIGTIPYEVTCNINKRVPRVYLE
jgi:alanine racemase